MAQAFISPNMLTWARQRARMSADDLAQKLPTKTEKVLAWEDGAAYPTIRQAEKIAKVCRIPFGYLYLNSPPEDKINVPDLRTVGGEDRDTYSLDFIDVYYDLVRKQDWYREYRLQSGFDELPFVGSFTLGDDPNDVAKNIREMLGIDSTLRQSATSWEQFINKLIGQAEKAGILILRNSVVGNNTHRPLSVDEFRGLALTDAIAPLIFINSADAKPAQIFTIAHELAHIWVGQSGISNPQIKPNGNSNTSVTEVFCNKVAAETLVPRDELIYTWNDNYDIETNLTELVKIFKVSRMVIARRCYDLDKINYEDFQQYYLAELEKFRRIKQRLSENDSGPGPYVMLRLRNGRLFSEAVLSAVFEGRLTFRDAGQLLGTKPANLKAYAENLNVN